MPILRRAEGARSLPERVLEESEKLSALSGHHPLGPRRDPASSFSPRECPILAKTPLDTCAQIPDRGCRVMHVAFVHRREAQRCRHDPPSRPPETPRAPAKNGPPERSWRSREAPTGRAAATVWRSHRGRSASSRSRPERHARSLVGPAPTRSARAGRRNGENSTGSSERRVRGWTPGAGGDRRGPCPREGCSRAGAAHRGGAFGATDRVE